MLNAKIVRIAGSLAKQMMRPLMSGLSHTVFLCGGSAPAQDLFRRRLGKAIEQISRHSFYDYRVYYPEDMFTELVYGPRRMDFLSLENMLAESVDAVVVIVHSTGTFTELGAFANHGGLRKKLIVVIDKAHRRASSFVNLGPVRLLRQTNKEAVLASDMSLLDCHGLARSIAKVMRAIWANARPRGPVFDLSGKAKSPDVSREPKPTIEDGLTNLVWSLDFYMALVLVLGPVPRDIVLLLAGELCPGDCDTATLVAETCLNTLTRQAPSAG